MWHGQHASVGANSPNVPFPEVGGKDKQKKKPSSWGANQRFQLLNCLPNTYWPVESCPAPRVQAGKGKNKVVNQTGDNAKRVDLIESLIRWFIDNNILVWDFIEFMWDFDHDSWFDDENPS